MGLLDVFNLHFAEIALAVAFCVGIYSGLLCSGLIIAGCLFGLWICLKVIRKKTAGRIETKDKAVFITGCDTGFGHDLARRLDELEFHVFAGCHHPQGDGAKKLKAASSKRLHIVPIDVGSDSSMEDAHEYVKENLPKGGLWAIVSNAGFNVMGDVEWLTISLYQKCMNVNFYGAIRAIRNFLYLVRKNKGRVVIMSSVKGLTGWPADSAYHLTKHGLETMADSLRLEMRKFGVQVSVVEPGNFSTATDCQNEIHFKRYEEEADEMWNNASEDVRSTYGRVYLDNMLAQQRVSIGGSAATTKRVIDAMEDALVSGRPETRYVVDGGKLFDYHTTIARYYGYVPTWLMDWVITKMTSCDKFPERQKEKAE